jgi:hypothetical protein
MGMLISFDFVQQARRRAAIQPGATGEIVFFTGVRYERHDTVAETPLRDTSKHRVRTKKPPLKPRPKKSA